MPKKIDWPGIEEGYVTGRLTYREVAKAYNIGLSSVEAKAASGDWAAKRKAYRLANELGIVAAVQTQIVPIADTVVDPMKIVDLAIAQYAAKIPELEPRSLERATDSLCRLIELRSKLHPPDLESWVKLTLEYGFNLKEVAVKMKEILG